MTLTPDALVQKYRDIIQEEVNVKTVTILPNTFQVQKQYVPVGKELSAKHGKNTGRIIAAAKAGQIEEAENNTLIVTDATDSRILEAGEYEVRYSGIDETHQTVESGVIVSLDLTLTQALKDEGVARELSRFLNQLRKEADFQVQERVVCRFSTRSTYLTDIITTYRDYLQQEALLTRIEAGSESGAIQSEYSGEEGSVLLILER